MRVCVCVRARPRVCVCMRACVRVTASCASVYVHEWAALRVRVRALVCVCGRAHNALSRARRRALARLCAARTPPKPPGPRTRKREHGEQYPSAPASGDQYQHLDISILDGNVKVDDGDDGDGGGGSYNDDRHPLSILQRIDETHPLKRPPLPPPPNPLSPRLRQEKNVCRTER